MAWNGGRLPAESLLDICDAMGWGMLDESGVSLLIPDQMFGPDGYKFTAEGPLDWEGVKRVLSGSEECCEVGVAAIVLRLLDDAPEEEKKRAREAGVYEEIDELILREAEADVDGETCAPAWGDGGGAGDADGDMTIDAGTHAIPPCPAFPFHSHPLMHFTCANCYAASPPRRARHSSPRSLPCAPSPTFSLPRTHL